MITSADIGRLFILKIHSYKAQIILDIGDHFVQSVYYDFNNKCPEAGQSPFSWYKDVDTEPDFEWYPMPPQSLTPVYASPPGLDNWSDESRYSSSAQGFTKPKKDHTGHTIIKNIANGEVFRVCKQCCEEVE